MSRHKPFLGLFLLYIIKIISISAEDLSTKQDECKNVCANTYFLMPLLHEIGGSGSCQRGCRIFNIIDAKGDLNTTKTKDDCHSSCNEAYNSPDFEACTLGCTEMQKKREIELSKGFILYIEQEGQNNMMVIQPEIDQGDLDILADPGLRSQIDLGYNIEYKIPETRIRTMPIVEGDSFGIPPDMIFKTYQPNGDWLDCASRNSGIPRWLLISAILLAILLGIRLIFASEKREPLPMNDLTDQENFICEFPLPPPKYSLESEKC